MYSFVLEGARRGDEAGPGRPGAGPVGSVTDNQE